MKQSQFGPCGLYCGACGATDCDGCQSTNVDEWVTNCQFRQCSRKKQLTSCAFCDEYPCPDLNNFMHDKWPHHWPMAPNLEYIQKHGIEAWLRQQEKEWRCPSCAAEIKWYQPQCACGHELNAWTLPEGAP